VTPPEARSDQHCALVHILRGTIKFFCFVLRTRAIFKLKMTKPWHILARPTSHRHVAWRTIAHSWRAPLSWPASYADSSL
jgi:hypothetical protein